MKLSIAKRAMCVSMASSLLAVSGGASVAFALG